MEPVVEALTKIGTSVSVGHDADTGSRIQF